MLKLFFCINSTFTFNIPKTFFQWQLDFAFFNYKTFTDCCLNTSFAAAAFFYRIAFG